MCYYDWFGYCRCCCRLVVNVVNVVAVVNVCDVVCSPIVVYCSFFFCSFDVVFFILIFTALLNMFLALCYISAGIIVLFSLPFPILFCFCIVLYIVLFCFCIVFIMLIRTKETRGGQYRW